MRIAQVAPLVERVPPRSYGGTERVVHALCESLVSRGHDVTLFASGDSQTRADLVAIADRPLREAGFDGDPHVWHCWHLAEVLRMADRFDLIHFHLDYLHFPLCRVLNTPTVTTLHGRLDTPGIRELLHEFNDVPVVSISDAQRSPAPDAAWQRTVYNGISASDFGFQEAPGEWFAFLGRFSPEKGPCEAIRIAQQTGIPLRMAAKIDARDREFFDKEIRPHIDGELIQYVGEVDLAGKNELLAGARALLFPVSWPEPFGLVMIESLACGTPVIAFRRGSVPEVIRHGETGFIVDTTEEAVRAAEQLDQIDRATCRRYCEDNFSVERMVDGYERIYNELVRRRVKARQARTPSRNGVPAEPVYPRVTPAAAAEAAGLPGRPVY